MNDVNRRKALLVGSSGVALGLLPSNANATSKNTKPECFVSVHNFGAVGDGVTDDTAAIQAAINSVVTSQTTISRGHISFFGMQTHKISTQLEVNRKSIRFEGNNVALKWAGAASTAMIHVTDSTRCQFENLILLGQLNSQILSAFYFEGKKNSILGANRDIVIDGCIIGRKYSTDTTTGGTADATPYAGFKNGIIIGGTDGNNDAYVIKSTEVNSCHDGSNTGKAIGFLNDQSIWSAIQDTLVNDSDIGIYLGCDIQMRNISANRCKVTDIWGIRNISVNIFGFNAENSLIFIKSTGGASFSVNGGKLLRKSAVPSNFFRWENGGSLVLENLIVTNRTLTADTIYYRVGSKFSGLIRVRNCKIANGSNRDTWDIDTGGESAGSYEIDIDHDSFKWKTTRPYLDRNINPSMVLASKDGTICSNSGNTPLGEFFNVAYQYDLREQHLVSAFDSINQVRAKILNTTSEPIKLMAGRFRWMGLNDYVIAKSIHKTKIPLIPKSTGCSIEVTLPSAQLGDFITFTSGSAYYNQLVTAYVSRPNTVVIRVHNSSNENLSPAVCNFYVGKLKEFGRYQNTLMYVTNMIADTETVAMALDIQGAQLGAHTFVSYSNDLKGLLCTSYVSQNNVVTILLTNFTGNQITLETGYFKVMVAF